MADLSLLSPKDWELFQQGRFDDMSLQSRKYLTDSFTTGEVLAQQAERGLTSTIRGAQEMFGLTTEEQQEEDLDSERTSRMMTDTDTALSMTGMIGGGLLDPVTLPSFFLAPIRIGGAIATGAARGAVAGGVYGAIEPVYEEFEDSRLKNIAAGASFGTVLGGVAGGLGKLIKHGEAKVIPSEVPEEPPKLEIDGKRGTPDTEGNLLDDEGTVVLSAKEAEQKALEAIGEPAGEYRWNPQTSRVEVMEVTQPSIDLNMPRNLQGAKPRFNKLETQFDNDLDKALYIIGNPTTKSQSHAAYVDFVKQVTGLDDAGLRAFSKSARDELVRAAAKAPEVNGKLVIPRSTMVDSLIKNRTKPRVRPVQYQPKGVTKKTYFTEADLGVLNRLGLKVVQRSPNQISFQDALNKNKLLSTAEAAARLRALGWELDLSGMRKPKAAKVTKAAETAEAPVQAADEVPMQPATRAPDDIGVPRELGSVGARGVRPEKQFGPELMPETAARVGRAGRGGISQEEFLLRNLMEGDVRNVVVPKDVITQSGATLRGLMQTGAVELRKILDEYGNMANFIIQKKGDPRAMSNNEAAAFKWFYTDAMKKRDDILEQLAGVYRAGESLDTPQASRWAEDLMYYSGIDLFWKNEGTKASRALNARKLIAQQIAKNSKIKSLFPEIGC